MEIKEAVERGVAGDPRIYYAIQEAKRTDKSFTEKGNFFRPIMYTQAQCREQWFSAMAIGMRTGLEMSSIPGQRIGLYNNCKEPKQKEFLDKFYALAEEYNCAITFHPLYGMTVSDLHKSKV